jgi:hypothetical protein
VLMSQTPPVDGSGKAIEAPPLAVIKTTRAEAPECATSTSSHHKTVRHHDTKALFGRWLAVMKQLYCAFIVTVAGVVSHPFLHPRCRYEPITTVLGFAPLRFSQRLVYFDRRPQALNLHRSLLAVGRDAASQRTLVPEAHFSRNGLDACREALFCCANCWSEHPAASRGTSPKQDWPWRLERWAAFKLATGCTHRVNNALCDWAVGVATGLLVTHFEPPTSSVITIRLEHQLW